MPEPLNPKRFITRLLDDELQRREAALVAAKLDSTNHIPDYEEDVRVARVAIDYFKSLLWALNQIRETAESRIVALDRELASVKKELGERDRVLAQLEAGER